MSDYHIHPDFSLDAEGSIEAHCRSALSRGLGEICFTTHFDTEPETYVTDARIRVDGTWVSVDGEWQSSYFAAIDAAVAQFGKAGLTIRTGVEIGYHDDVVRRYAGMIRDWPFDYVLGSVHRLGGLAVTIPADLAMLLARGGREAPLVRYWQTVEKAATCGLFDCLGHLDVYRRTARDRAERDLRSDAVRAAAVRALQAAAANGVGIEVNSRDAAAGPGGVCPGPELLALAVEAGVRTFTTGSDAHSPDGVGVGVDSGLALLRAAGVSQIASFAHRVASLRAI